MKKLLIATDNFLPRWDGISRFLSEIIPPLSSEYDITVMCPKFEGEPVAFDNVKIIHFPLSKRRFGDISPAKAPYKNIKDIVRENDIVWSHNTIGPISRKAMIAAHSLKKPLIAYVHSLEWELFSKSVKAFNIFVYYITNILARWLYNKCSLIMVPSKELREILDWEGIYARKDVVYLGIDTERFKPARDRKLAKKEVGINPGFKVIGFCGRIGREKDLMTLYKAFLKLEKEYEKILLLIVGEGLKEQKEMFDIESNVMAVGRQDNVLPYLQAMDVFVLTSLTETTSLATLEAMSCGLAVVSTPVGRVKEYVKDKRNGLLFPKRNDLILSMKLKWLINKDNVRESIGKKARTTVLQGFRWSHTIDRIKGILERF